jgi:hypothetical protein
MINRFAASRSDCVVAVSTMPQFRTFSSPSAKVGDSQWRIRITSRIEAPGGRTDLRAVTVARLEPPKTRRPLRRALIVDKDSSFCGCGTARRAPASNSAELTSNATALPWFQDDARLF